MIEDVKHAANAVCDAVVSAAAAVQNAWDNLDPGLKQWIINGAAFAISFIPIAGPLISCIIDGTFVDMWNAIQRGDWAMLALSCAAFVPGMKGLKSGTKMLSTFSKVEKMSALEKLTLKVGGKTYKASEKTVGKIASGNHLEQIAKNSGAKDLKETMEFIGKKGESAIFAKRGNEIGRGVYDSNPLRFVLDDTDNTIVTLFWKKGW